MVSHIFKKLFLGEKFDINFLGWRISDINFYQEPLGTLIEENNQLQTYKSTDSKAHETLCKKLLVRTWSSIDIVWDIPCKNFSSTCPYQTFLAIVLAIFQSVLLYTKMFCSWQTNAVSFYRKIRLYCPQYSTIYKKWKILAEKPTLSPKLTITRLWQNIRDSG